MPTTLTTPTKRGVLAEPLFWFGYLKSEFLLLAPDIALSSFLIPSFLKRATNWVLIHAR
jgi:hypothetical protein